MHYNCTINFYPCMIHLPLYSRISGRNKCTIFRLENHLVAGGSCCCCCFISV